MPKSDWEAFEDRCNAELGLDSTVASGATWKDKGDGTTRDVYAESWPLTVDAKTTIHNSFSLREKFLEDMLRTAQQSGKTFALPLLFLSSPKKRAWAVVPLDDYAYLVEHYRKTADGFTEEDVSLIETVAKVVKTAPVVEHLGKIVTKMGRPS